MKKWLATVTAGAVIAGATVTSAGASTVKVQKGDTLWKIANDHGMSVDQLMELNNLHSTLIFPGQVLEVHKIHVVKPGDTLFAIALEYDVTVKQIKEWNNLKSSLIFPGQKLYVEDPNKKSELTAKSDDELSNDIQIIEKSEEQVAAELAEAKQQAQEEAFIASQLEVQQPVEEVEEPTPEEESAEPAEEVEEPTPEEESAEPAEEVEEPTPEEESAEPAEEVEEPTPEEESAEPAEEVEEPTLEEESAEPAKEAESIAEEVEQPVNEAEESEPQEETQAHEEVVASGSQVDSRAQEKAERAEAAKEEQSQTLTVEATAYTADCEGCSGITATGIDLRNNRNAKVIAVDPNVIPLGSTVHVEGYGTAIAGDTGGAIKGNRIDVHMPTTEEALEWGRRTVNVTVTK